MSLALFGKAIDSLLLPPYEPNLIQGDCLSVLPSLEKESVHLVITDPPYFLDGLCSNWKNGDKVGKGVINGLPVGMKFDPKQGVELQRYIGAVAEKIMPLMVSGGFAIFFSQPRLSHRMAIALEDAGFEIRDLLAWRYTKRSQFKAFSQDHFIKKMDIPQKEKKHMIKRLEGRKTPQLRPQFESMILAQKPKIGTFVENWIKYRTGLIDPTQSLDGRTPSTVITVEKPDKDGYNNHLTVKPVPLIKHLIELFSVKGQVVLDPFIGSGTTALACKMSERNCIGIEINNDYLNICKQRLGDYTL